MKQLKLDADSSHTGKLEGMNAPWSRLLHLATRYTYPKRYPLVLAGDAMFDFYYLAKGRLRIMHGTENGRERAMVYVGSGNVFNEATALAGFDDPDCRFYCMEDVELYRFPGTLLHDPRFLIELRIIDTDFVTLHPSFYNGSCLCLSASLSQPLPQSCPAVP